jgi:hypothetical protein
VFSPEGIRFDGTNLAGTGTTLPVFNHLNPISDVKKDLVDQNSASWNRVVLWMRQLDGLIRAS